MHIKVHTLLTWFIYMRALNMPYYHKITKVNFSEWNHQAVFFVLFYTSDTTSTLAARITISVLLFSTFLMTSALWLHQFTFLGLPGFPLLPPVHLIPATIKHQLLKSRLCINKLDTSTLKHCWNLAVVWMEPLTLISGIFKPFLISRQFNSASFKFHEELTLG